MIGLTIMKWDERIGAEIIAKYPAELEIPQETLMQIYSTHEYSGEAGMISLFGGTMAFASYYTGQETQVYIIAVLELNDNPDLYEDGLGDMAQNVLPYVENPTALNNVLPNLFQRLSLYPTMNWEQHVLMLMDDEIRRQIMKRFRSEGSLIKSELNIWLKDKFQEGFFDVETVLRPFYNVGLVEGKTIRNVDYVFLVRDILIHRRPALKVLKDLSKAGLPAGLHAQFLDEVKIYFNSYKPNEEDMKELIKTLLDAQVFEVFKLLRIACVTRPQLEKLKKKGVEDIDGTIKKLWDAGMISVLYDEHKNEYYALKTDVKISKIYAEHILNAVKDQYLMKTKGTDILLNHLQMLNDNYTKHKEEMVKLEAALAEEEE